MEIQSSNSQVSQPVKVESNNTSAQQNVVTQERPEPREQAPRTEQPATPILAEATQSAVIEPAPRAEPVQVTQANTQKAYEEVENKSSVDVEKSKLDIAV